MPKQVKAKQLTKSRSTRQISGNGAMFRLEFEALAKRIDQKKKVSKGKIILEMDDIDYESLQDAIEKASDYELQSEVGEENAQSLMDLFIQKDWALKAILSKGPKEKHFKECAMRLGWEPPKKGKKPTFDPDRVKDYYKALIKNLPHGSQDEKYAVIEKVYKQFGFASKNSAYQYLKVHGIKGLPWQG